MKIRMPLFLMAFLAVAAIGEPSRQAQQLLERLNERKEEEHWTFRVGYSPVLERPMSESTGLVAPPDWEDKAMFVTLKKSRALPAEFDWRREAEGLPPIKDQGGCGSCWAFATVGVFESVLKIREWKTKSLSEQYLVSCNREGYSCAGGWWAHKYHQTPGSVGSSSFPYVAKNVACKSSLSYGDQVASWAYVGGGGNQSTPSVDAIKNAIYQYGPVAVAVYADNVFQGYKGGVFNSCGNWSQPNHAVVLVGWSDSGGYWLMRNSWGTRWGEKGYMRIKYGCNLIGRAASYVVYNARCNPSPVADAGEDHVVKLGQTVQLGTSSLTGHRYRWSPETGLDDPTSPTPLASPKASTTYTLQADTTCGTAEHRVKVTVTN